MRENKKKISHAFKSNILFIKEILKLLKRILVFIFRHVLNFLYDPEIFSILSYK